MSRVTIRWVARLVFCALEACRRDPNAHEPRVDTEIVARAHWSEQKTPSTPEDNEPSESGDAVTPAPAAPAAPPGSVGAAMSGFSRAIEQRDPDALLKYFSTRGFTYLGTIEQPNRALHVTLAELTRDLRAGPSDTGWYAALLSDEDESFALATASAKGRPWRQIGVRKFVLPDDDADSTLYVLWRREGAHWVVDTIAVPGA